MYEKQTSVAAVISVDLQDETDVQGTTETEPQNVPRTVTINAKTHDIVRKRNLLLLLRQQLARQGGPTSSSNEGADVGPHVDDCDL